MNYQNNSQPYTRPVVRVGSRTGGLAQKSLRIPGGILLWRAIGKAALVIVPITLVVTIILSSSIANLERSISLAEQQRQMLEDKNIVLLARKARVWSSDNVEKLAAEKLSLHNPTKKQVGKFNRRTGVFSYL